MKKAIVGYILFGAILFSGCSSNDQQTQSVPDQQTTANNSAESIPETKEKNDTSATGKSPDNKLSKATAELCSCMNSYLADMNSTVRDAIIKAGKSDNPMASLTAEIQKAASQDDQQRLLWELERLDKNGQMQKCADNVRVKYGLDENAMEQKEQFLQAASENKKCELMYSLMKIGLQQEEMIRSMQNQR